MTKNEIQKYDDLIKQEVQALEDSAGTVYDPKPQIIEIIHQHQKFNMPDGDTENTLKVIVLGSIKFRSMFEGSGEDSVSLCQSLGGKTGQPSDAGKDSKWTYLQEPNPMCEACPANFWGSGANGKGKACKEKRNMLLYDPRYNTGLILRIPVMSVDNHDQHYNKAKAKSRAMVSFWTELSLTEKKRGEQVYSIIRFEMGDDVEKETVLQSLDMRKEFEKWISHIEETPQDFTQTQQGSPVQMNGSEPPPSDDDSLPF